MGSKSARDNPSKTTVRSQAGTTDLQSSDLPRSLTSLRRKLGAERSEQQLFTVCIAPSRPDNACSAPKQLMHRSVMQRGQGVTHNLNCSSLVFLSVVHFLYFFFFCTFTTTPKRTDSLTQSTCCRAEASAALFHLCYTASAVCRHTSQVMCQVWSSCTCPSDAVTQKHFPQRHHLDAA